MSILDNPAIKKLKKKMDDYPSDFRPGNIASFTDKFGNRVYLKTNYEKVTYNPKTKQRSVEKLSEEDFFKIYADFSYDLNH